LGKPNISIFFPLPLQSDGHSFSKMNALGVASIKSTTQDTQRWYDLTLSPFVAYWGSWLDLLWRKPLGM
jgi:hypothetical protein